MVAIVNYGMGNIHSVKRKLDNLGVESIVSCDFREILTANRIILPGVGHFGRAMDELQKLDLIKTLHEVALEKKTPILGICLGMQLMTKGSDEGGTEGLGWFNCKTEKLIVDNPIAYKVPHTGWNTIQHNASESIFENVPTESEVYFVHSFGVNKAPENETLCTTVYSNTFVSGLKKDALIGMQFHPEKSHDCGLQLLNNFIHKI
jgi:glutamine amidotransferase